MGKYESVYKTINEINKISNIQVRYGKLEELKKKILHYKADNENEYYSLKNNIEEQVNVAYQLLNLPHQRAFNPSIFSTKMFMRLLMQESYSIAGAMNFIHSNVKKKSMLDFVLEFKDCVNIIKSELKLDLSAEDIMTFFESAKMDNYPVPAVKISKNTYFQCKHFIRKIDGMNVVHNINVLVDEEDPFIEVVQIDKLIMEYFSAAGFFHIISVAEKYKGFEFICKLEKELDKLLPSSTFHFHKLPLCSDLRNVPRLIYLKYLEFCNYTYVDVKYYGSFPMPSFAMPENYLKTKNLSDYARGFIDGYKDNLIPFIDDKTARTELIINEAFKPKNRFFFLSDENIGSSEIYHLYDFGLFEGKRYKAWDIILKTPVVFSQFLVKNDLTFQQDTNEENSLTVNDIICKNSHTIVYPKVSIPKAIVFDSQATIVSLHDAIKGFFIDNDEVLKKILEGVEVDSFLVFPSNCNKFVELFRRLKYNGKVLSNYIEIRDWICKYFKFTQKIGGVTMVKSFSKKSVYDILIGKIEPKKTERLLPDLAWLKYISKSELDRIGESEKQ